uniref:G-protein coupled receptors family 1 profile domain-containing protein n=1 Tax=Plectus sambesii TaxID=2011161 RepID=A0A914UL14_9BILA
MTIGTLLLSIFGVFGNWLILFAIIITKSLHNRCNILIGTLAGADLICSIYFVELRIIILARGFFWSNAKCFLWSTYGLFAMNIQSGMGLALGADRLLAIAKPIKYRSWSNTSYIAALLCPVLAYAIIVTAFGYTESSAGLSVAVCFPPSAYVLKARNFWIGSNVVIVVLVLLAYSTAQYKIRRASNLSKGNDANLTATKRLLDSLTCVMVVYAATWALTVLALLLTQVIAPGTNLAKAVELQLSWLVLINTSSSVLIYAWRAQDYRQAFVRILTCGEFAYAGGFKKTTTVQITSKLSTSNMSMQNTRRNSVVSIRIPAI